MPPKGEHGTAILEREAIQSRASDTVQDPSDDSKPHADNIAQTAANLAVKETVSMEFGPKYEVIPFRLKEANCLPQMRKSIISDDLDDLISSIDSISPNDPKDEHEIINKYFINCPEYAIMTPFQAQAYLSVINQTWKTNVATDELIQRSDGSYVIVTSGHRRTIAARKIAERHGAPEEQVIIRAQALRQETDADSNESVANFVHEVLSRQLAENVYAPPTPDRYARIIYETYQLGRAAGRYKSKSDYYLQMNIGEEKGRSAFRFMELPEAIRSLVHEGQLTYGKAIGCHLLIEPYLAYLTAFPYKVTTHAASTLAGEDWAEMSAGDRAERCLEYRLQLFCAEFGKKKKSDFEVIVKNTAKALMEDVKGEETQLFSLVDATKDRMSEYLENTKRIIRNQTLSIITAGENIKNLSNRFRNHSKEELKAVSAALQNHIGQCIAVLVNLHIENGMAPKAAEIQARAQVAEALELHSHDDNSIEDCNLLVA